MRALQLDHYRVSYPYTMKQVFIRSDLSSDNYLKFQEEVGKSKGGDRSLEESS